MATLSLERFAEPWAKKLLDVWQSEPETWRWAVDDFYAREAVEKVPKTVGRFLRLSPVLLGVIPNDEVSIYVREATRCFIYGFFQASIALCRAALELGLNHLFKRRMGAIPDMLLAIRSAKPAGEKLAFDTLVNSRGILRELYEK